MNLEEDSKKELKEIDINVPYTLYCKDKRNNVATFVVNYLYNSITTDISKEDFNKYFLVPIGALYGISIYGEREDYEENHSGTSTDLSLMIAQIPERVSELVKEYLRVIKGSELNINIDEDQDEVDKNQRNLLNYVFSECDEVYIVYADDNFEDEEEY